jgi:hypothetical protein
VKKFKITFTGHTEMHTKLSLTLHLANLRITTVYHPDYCLQAIYHGLQREPSLYLPSDSSLPDELNPFYACFEKSNTQPRMRTPAVPDDCVISISRANVSKTFKQVTIHKATGPECLLRACTNQLASVFTNIFQLSLTQPVIPTCFKETTIVPVPKNGKVTCQNYYCLVALTSVAMKCFERLVMANMTHSNLHTDQTDHTDDTISIALHTALSHWDKES